MVGGRPAGTGDSSGASRSDGRHRTDQRPGRWTGLAPDVQRPLRAGRCQRRPRRAAHRRAGRPAAQSGPSPGGRPSRLLGAGYLDGIGPRRRTRLAVPVAANGDRLRSSDALDVHRVSIEEGDVVIRYGVRCAMPERALFDAMRWTETFRVRRDRRRHGGRRRADPRRRAGLRSRPAARHTTGSSHSRRSVVPTKAPARRRGPAAAHLAAPLRAGHSPLTNRTVLQPGWPPLGRPDLISERLGMGAEFDGAEHRDRARHRQRRTTARRLPASRSGDRDVRGRGPRRRGLVVDRLQATRRRARSPSNVAGGSPHPDRPSTSVSTCATTSATCDPRGRRSTP